MSTTPSDLEFVRATVRARQGFIAQVHADCAAHGFVPTYVHAMLDSLGLRASGERYMSQAEIDAAAASRRKPAATPAAARPASSVPPAATSTPIAPAVRAASTPANAAYGERMRTLLAMRESRGAELLAHELAAGSLPIAEAQDCLRVARGGRPAQASGRPAATITIDAQAIYARMDAAGMEAYARHYGSAPTDDAGSTTAGTDPASVYARREQEEARGRQLLRGQAA